MADLRNWQEKPIFTVFLRNTTFNGSRKVWIWFLKKIYFSSSCFWREIDGWEKKRATLETYFRLPTPPPPLLQNNCDQLGKYGGGEKKVNSHLNSCATVAEQHGANDVSGVISEQTRRVIQWERVHIHIRQCRSLNSNHHPVGCAGHDCWTCNHISWRYQKKSVKRHFKLNVNIFFFPSCNTPDSIWSAREWTLRRLIRIFLKLGWMGGFQGPDLGTTDLNCWKLPSLTLTLTLKKTTLLFPVTLVAFRVAWTSGKKQTTTCTGRLLTPETHT